MKNKNKNKRCKSCNKNDVISKKVNTMEKGVEYIEEVEKNETPNDKTYE